MFVSLGGDNYIGLFTAVVDRFASIVLLRRYFILCLNTRTIALNYQNILHCML